MGGKHPRRDVQEIMGKGDGAAEGPQVEGTFAIILLLCLLHTDIQKPFKTGLFLRNFKESKMVGLGTNKQILFYL